MDSKSGRKGGNRESPPKREDPEPEELEIDAANDAAGGPTTASHSAGLSSSLRAKDEAAEDASNEVAGARKDP
ncbi:MAG: hypothetical protein JWN69_723 [Alphaproteobacteria bacterium]|nr:hypothetical protein [Alphaproteobacteria bacterium]